MLKERKISYNLFLDDVRMPQQAFLYTKRMMYLEQPWLIARNFDQFVEIIEENGLPQVISFDHDLADEHYAPQEHWENYDSWAEQQEFKEKTGKDCALWLVDYCMDNNLLLPEFYCHSMNPVGYENILSVLNQYKKYEEKN